MPRQARACPGHAGVRPAPGIYTRGASWKLRAANMRVGELGKELRTMGIVGCGIMMAGLMSWALLGCIGLGTGFIGIGTLLVAGAYIQEKRKEEHAQAWRKNYPSYKY